MRADLLHTVAVISNPIRWDSRKRLFRQFQEHMLDSGTQLTVVECAIGDRPFEIDEHPHVDNVRVRAHTLVWSKEDLQRIGVTALTRNHPGWKHLHTPDADIQYRKAGWAAEVVHALQLYDVIQPWGDCYDLGPNDDHLAHHVSFLKLWTQRKPILQGPNANSNGYRFGHPGYSWAWNRSAYNNLGGFITTAALGAGDHHMAMALVGRASDSIHGGCTEAYRRPILQWQDRAMRHVYPRLGFIPGTIEHFWHGSKDNRAYVSRWEILVKHKFDPYTDLKFNEWGVQELAGNKPELARDLDAYFRQRDEDSNTLGGGPFVLTGAKDSAAG